MTGRRVTFNVDQNSWRCLFKMHIPWPQFDPAKSESQNRPWEFPFKTSALGHFYKNTEVRKL